MTLEEIRAEAAQRIAKVEHARLYPGMPWEKVRAEDRVWLLEEAAVVVDALGDMLPTGQLLGWRCEGEGNADCCAGAEPCTWTSDEEIIAVSGVMPRWRQYTHDWQQVTE